MASGPGSPFSLEDKAPWTYLDVTFLRIYKLFSIPTNKKLEVLTQYRLLLPFLCGNVSSFKKILRQREIWKTIRKSGKNHEKSQACLLWKSLTILKSKISWHGDCYELWTLYMFMLSRTWNAQVMILKGINTIQVNNKPHKKMPRKDEKNGERMKSEAAVSSFVFHPSPDVDSREREKEREKKSTAAQKHNWSGIGKRSRYTFSQTGNNVSYLNKKPHAL